MVFWEKKKSGKSLEVKGQVKPVISILQGIKLGIGFGIGITISSLIVILTIVLVFGGAITNFFSQIL